jgi:hypothetical protein
MEDHWNYQEICQRLSSYVLTALNAAAAAAVAAAVAVAVAR